MELLGKSIFLLSGGALTISIGLFLKQDSAEMLTQIVCFIRAAWLLLFLSILSFVMALGVMIIRDYNFGEHWSKKINGENVQEISSSRWYDVIIWIFGIGTVLCILLGFGSLGWVSSKLL